MIKLTGNERNEVRYRPRAKRKNQLLSLQMSRCLYQYYPLLSTCLPCFFLSDGTWRRTETMHRIRRYALFLFPFTFIWIF